MLYGVGHTTTIIVAASVPNGVITIKMIPQKVGNVKFFSGLIGIGSPRAPFFHRSAGACPPRALEYARHGEGQALALR